MEITKENAQTQTIFDQNKLPPREWNECETDELAYTRNLWNVSNENKDEQHINVRAGRDKETVGKQMEPLGAF